MNMDRCARCALFPLSRIDLVLEVAFGRPDKVCNRRGRTGADRIRLEVETLDDVPTLGQSIENGIHTSVAQSVVTNVDHRDMAGDAKSSAQGDSTCRVATINADLAFKISCSFFF